MVGRDAAESIKIITREASERIARFAFDYAVANGRHKVTAVHKANIMKLSDGLFLESCRTVAADYDGRVEFEDRIVDNMCMQLVQKPELYDVLVLPEPVRRHRQRPRGGPRRRPGRRARGEHRDRGGRLRAGPRLGAEVRRPGQGEPDGADPVGRADAPPPRLPDARRPASRRRSARSSPRGATVTYDLGGTAGTAAFADAVIERMARAHRLHAGLTARTSRRTSGGLMLVRYRGGEGMLAWAFHRISGVAIWLFVVLHVVDIFLVGAAPERLRQPPRRSMPRRAGSSWSGCSARPSCTTRSTACGSWSWTSGRR